MDISNEAQHDQHAGPATAYEPPALTVIGPVSAFTFGSGHDASDHSTTKTGGGHRVP